MHKGFKLLWFLVSLFCCSNAKESCRPEIVESVPDGLKFNETSVQPKEVHLALIEMIDSAKHSIKIASFYLTLIQDKYEHYPPAEPGRKIVSSIKSAVKRGVKLEVAIDNSRSKSICNPAEIELMENLGTVYKVNMKRLLGDGVMHSKFMIIDDESLYVGSSNFDWRSYTQVKEIGVVIKACKSLGQDLAKIFSTYKLMSEVDGRPDKLPENLRTTINMENPLKVNPDGQEYDMYIAGSPPAFTGNESGTGRTDDIDAILRTIDSAKEFVYVSVMNYNVRTAYSWPKKYWPVIDNALRRAATERRIQVKLLFSDWKSTRDEEYMWYRSLNELHGVKSLGKGGIHVKVFKVDSYDDEQKKIPFARVKHDKYIVTDKAVYIGTSNWTPEYFTNSAGVGLVIEPKGNSIEGLRTPVDDMTSIFERDFNSEFSRYVS